LGGEEFQVVTAGLRVVRECRVEEFFAEGGVFLEGRLEFGEVGFIR
jgi:hypothetical protein